VLFRTIAVHSGAAGCDTIATNSAQRRAIIMDIDLSTEITLSSDGNLVQFVAALPERSVQCAISREALECHFWVPSGADGARLLKAYLEGRKRIAVMVERRLMRKEPEPIVLNAKHFSG
jgi:hypothetical protein